MPSLKLYLQLYKTNSQKYPVSGPLDDSVRLTCLLKKLALKLARIEKSDFSFCPPRHREAIPVYFLNSAREVSIHECFYKGCLLSGDKRK